MSSFSLALAVCLLAGGASPGAQDAAPRYDRPVEDWYEGPVRYLLSADEEKRYRSLGAEPERVAFIEDFWARRDDRPETPANEFQIRFWKRVEEADRMFRDAPYPGWKTDRGKLYVLVGPPDEIREGQATSRTRREVPFVVWIYHEPRFEGMARDTEVRFAKDPSGEYRITDQLFFGRMERLSDRPRTLFLEAGAAQKPPEPRAVLDTIAAAHPPIDPGRHRTHYDFFKAEDGSTSVLLTLGIRPESPQHAGSPSTTAPQSLPASRATWKVYARLAGETGSYDLGDPDSFRTSDAGANAEGFRLYQGRISVPAGTYSVFFAVQDEATQEIHSLGDRLVVPDFTRQPFSLSGITLASRLEPIGEGEADSPFRIGSLLVIPKMEPVFPTGAEFAFYFQVYGARPDPGTGEARLDLSYQFFQASEVRKTGEPGFSAVGKPLLLEDQAGLVHGYAFPLQGWPAGRFRLKVTVKDRTSGSATEAEADFTVR